MQRELRRFLSGSVIPLAVFLAGIVLLVLGLVIAQRAWQDHRQLNQVEQSSQTIDALLHAIHAQAFERGLVNTALGRADTAGMAERLEAAQREAEDAWNEVLTRLSKLDAGLPEDSSIHMQAQALREALDKLSAIRERVALQPSEAELEATSQEWFDASTRANAAAGNLRVELMLQAGMDHEVLALHFLMVHSLARNLEFSGQVRGLMGYYLSAGKPVPPAQLQRALTSKVLARLNRRELIDSADRFLADPALRSVFENWRDATASNMQMVDEVFAAADSGNYPVDSREWFTRTSAAIDATFGLTQAATKCARDHARVRARHSLLRLAVYLVLALAAALAAFMSLRRVRRQADEVLAHKALSEAILESVADAVLATDARGRVRYINPVAEELTGWSQEEAHGRHYGEVMRIFNRLNTSQTDPLGFCLAHGLIVVLTEGHVLVNRQGEEIPIEDSCAPIRDARGEISGAVLIFTSKDRTRSSDRILTYHATHDALTGLGNRRMFEQRAEELIRHAQETGTCHVLAFIDLDNFRVVNDVGGHAAGDQMLRQIAFLIRKNIRDSDLAARLGGDEFGLLLRKCNADQARRVAHKLIDAVGQFRFPWDGQVFTTGLSIGIVEVSATTPDIDGLLQEADTACYAAKEQGRNHVVVRHPESASMADAPKQARWVPRLQQALENNLFELHCQEIRPLRKELAPRIEILRRLREDGELGPPGAFIPAAERHGLMPEIDRWVIANTCRALARRLSVDSRLQCNINLSGTSLTNPEIVEFIVDTVHHHGIDPARIRFEITETAAMVNLDQSINIMEQLVDEGFAFALDDFGSGLSSLSYLRELPVNMVKIDGSFTKRLPDDPVAQAMIEAIVTIARLMDIRTCAEYVEDAQSAEFLTELGVDYGQGFHFNRPRPLSGCLVLEPAGQ